MQKTSSGGFTGWLMPAHYAPGRMPSADAWPGRQHAGGAAGTRTRRSHRSDTSTVPSPRGALNPASDRSAHRGRRCYRPARSSSRTARRIQDACPFLSSPSCAAQSKTIRSPLPSPTSHAAMPRLVHGVCQLVMVITSGQMILRPAPHMPVKSWHRSQNPSRAATGSGLCKPQPGQLHRPAPVPSRPRCKSPALVRHGMRRVWITPLGVRPTSARPGPALDAREVVPDMGVRPFVTPAIPPTGESPAITECYDRASCVASQE